MSDDAHNVINAAEADGVYVIGCGIDEAVAPVLVSVDDVATEAGFPLRPMTDGGFNVLELHARRGTVL